MERRKFVMGLGALAAGSSAAVGSGAFSATQIDDRDIDIQVKGDTAALIQLEPGHRNSVVGSDSTITDERVFIDDDGKLAISFNDNDGGNGINPGSSYQVGAIGPDLIDSVSSQAEESDLVDNFEDEVLYGPSEVGLDRQEGEVTTTVDDPAFELRNESSQNYRFRMRYDSDDPPENADVIVVGTEQGTDREEAFIFSATSGGEARTQNIILNGGDAYRFSLLAIANSDAKGEAFDESLQINLTETSV